MRIQRGGGGRGSGPPPGKSQVLWVSIGNKQLDPPPPPPPLEKVGPPLKPRKMIDFFESDHLTSVKNKLRTKKKKKTLSEIVLSD